VAGNVSALVTGGGFHLPVRALISAHKPHCQVEGPLRRRQPVRLVVRARALVLEVELERAVSVVLEGHPARHGEPVQRIGDLEALEVIQRHRPETGCEIALACLLCAFRLCSSGFEGVALNLPSTEATGVAPAEALAASAPVLWSAVAVVSGGGRRN
jgi:hypothetical protein